MHAYFWSQILISRCNYVAKEEQIVSRDNVSINNTQYVWLSKTVPFTKSSQHPRRQREKSHCLSASSEDRHRAFQAIARADKWVRTKVIPKLTQTLGVPTDTWRCIFFIFPPYFPPARSLSQSEGHLTKKETVTVLYTIWGN